MSYNSPFINLKTLNTTMKKIQYSVGLMVNPQKPEDAKKAYAFLQLTGIVNLLELARHITLISVNE